MCEGCADFVPSRLDSGSSHYAVPQFECFSAVLRKAANWIQMQRRVRVTNVQSIDYKLKHEAGLHASAVCPNTQYQGFRPIQERKDQWRSSVVKYGG